MGKKMNITNIHMKFLLYFFIFFSPYTVWATIPLEKVTLQLQWKHQFEFAGFYAAKEKGFYKESGLDVTIKEYSKDFAPVESILSKKADYAISYSSIIIDYLQGKPLVFLANFFKQSPLAIVVQPEIKQPQQLTGKKVMGNFSGIDGISLQMMFRQFGVDTETFSHVDSSYNIDAFANHEVDAMSVFKTNELFLLQERGIKYNLFDPTVYGIAFYDVNLFTSEDEIKLHPGRAKRFRDASIKGWKYALENQSEMIKLILDKYNTQNKTYDMLDFEAKQVKRVMMPDLYPIGYIDAQRVQLMAENFMQLGLLPKETSLEFEHFIYHKAAETLKLNDKEINYLQQKKEITYCVDPNWMPIEMIKNGKHIGISHDYIEKISSKLNIPFKLVPTKSWEQALTYAKDRRCDLLSAAMSTPNRAFYLKFTNPYLNIPLVIATKIYDSFITNIADVQHKKIAVVKSYAIAELLSYKYPKLNLIEVDSLTEGLKKVASGELYGIIDNLTTIGYHIQKNHIGSLKISGTINKELQLAFGVRDDDKLLLSIINKSINNIDEKTKQQIFNQWMSITYEQGFNYHFFLKLLAVVIILLILVYLHYRTIRQHNKKLQSLSDTDPLTGLFNRRYLDKIIHKEAQDTERYSTFFSIILLDIDNFKRINDTFGHPKGDVVLKQVTKILLDNSRKNDSIGRWGGEEFLLVCPQTNLENAQVLAQKLCHLLESATFEIDRQVTGSFGVTEYKKGSSYTDCFKKVDEALYKAKEQGKNRVVSL